jgi:hypothetical protein
MHNIFRFATLKQALISLGYNLLYLFSLCQIKFNQLSRITSSYVKKTMVYLKVSPELKMQTIHHIDNSTGAVCCVHTLLEHRLLPVIRNAFECDKLCSILINYKNDETERLHKMFLTSCPERIECKLSNVNFIQVGIQYNSLTFNILLKTPDYTFYVVNNVLNANFFKYYLIHVAKYSGDVSIFDYTVTIIDNNANIFTMSPKQRIVFHENTYTLLTDDTIEEKNKRQ